MSIELLLTMLGMALMVGVTAGPTAASGEIADATEKASGIFGTTPTPDETTVVPDETPTPDETTVDETKVVPDETPAPDETPETPAPDEPALTEEQQLAELRLADKLREIDAAARQEPSPVAAVPDKPVWDPATESVYTNFVKDVGTSDAALRKLHEEDPLQAMAWMVAHGMRQVEERAIEEAVKRATADTQSSLGDQRVIDDAMNYLYTHFPALATEARTNRHILTAITEEATDLAQQLGYKTADEYILAAYKEKALDKIGKFANSVGQKVTRAFRLESAPSNQTQPQNNGSKASPKRAARATSEKGGARQVHPGASRTPDDEAQREKMNVFEGMFPNR